MLSWTSLELRVRTVFRVAHPDADNNAALTLMPLHLLVLRRLHFVHRRLQEM
jgi:hypothetical protein